MSNLNDQTIIITATVGPLKNGKRAVLVSAAPEGELPVVEMGNFAELKTLFDTVWLALLKRAPMVVPDKARKGEPEKTKPPAAKSDTADDDETENVETLDENGFDAYPPMTLSDIRALAHQWREAEPLLKRINAFCKWTDADPARVGLIARVLAGDKDALHQITEPRPTTLAKIYAEAQYA